MAWEASGKQLDNVGFYDFARAKTTSFIHAGRGEAPPKRKTVA